MATALGTTSCQSTCASGNHLKSLPNKTDKIASEATKLISSPIIALADVPEMAAIAALMIKETAKRNPRPRIPASETR